MSTKEDRSGLLTNDDYIDLDFTSEHEDDSLEDISHMQENSLTSCFNVGVDETSADKPDQSANQEEAPAETTYVGGSSTRNLKGSKVGSKREGILDQRRTWSRIASDNCGVLPQIHRG